MRQRVRRHLRQHDADAVAAADAETREGVREPVRTPVKIGERVRVAATVRVRLLQGDPVEVIVFADEVVGGVVVLREVPLEVRPGVLVGLGRHVDVPSHVMYLGRWGINERGVWPFRTI